MNCVMWDHIAFFMDTGPGPLALLSPVQNVLWDSDSVFQRETRNRAASAAFSRGAHECSEQPSVIRASRGSACVCVCVWRQPWLLAVPPIRFHGNRGNCCTSEREKWTVRLSDTAPEKQVGTRYYSRGWQSANRVRSWIFYRYYDYIFLFIKKPQYR